MEDIKARMAPIREGFAAAADSPADKVIAEALASIVESLLIDVRRIAVALETLASPPS